MQGKDRVVVRCVAEQLGLEGSYIPRTYIEQIQLEKLVNEVMVGILHLFFTIWDDMMVVQSIACLISLSFPSSDHLSGLAR